MSEFIWLVIGFGTGGCLAFVSFTIAERWSHLFLCGLLGVAIYAAIGYAVLGSIIGGGQFAAIVAISVSFFTVIMPVLTVSYLRFKNGE